jgi:hypothetical protein
MGGICHRSLEGSKMMPTMLQQVCNLVFVVTYDISIIT